MYGFVEPKTGKSHGYLIPRVNTQWLNVVLKTLAAFEEATAEKIILLYQFTKKMLQLIDVLFIS